MSSLLGVARELATTNVTEIAVPRFIPLVNDSFGGWAQHNATTPNWTGLLVNSIMVYPDAMGAIAYLILAIMPFLMMWISTGSIRMGVVIGVILFVWLGSYLFASAMVAGGICIVIAIIGLGWATLKWN